MRVRKYVDNSIKKRNAIIVLLVFVCVVFIGLFIYQSYGRYQDKVTFKLINGKLKMSGGSGDIEFAFYNGDQKIDTMPEKNNEEGLVLIKAECTNDAVIKWNNDDWDNIVVNNLKKTKTSCSLYFGSKIEKVCTFSGEESGACYLAKKSGIDTTNLTYDDTNDINLRYVGATPDNYVYFNCEDGVEASSEVCETWRIIGVMNNITEVSEDGQNKETNGTHIKIIRDKFDTLLSWDSSASGVNRGGGVNEWSEADIEKVLNDEYLNRSSGTNKCYKNENNVTVTCPDWANIGIRDEARNMIANIKWNTGTMAVAYDASLIAAKYMYEAERSSHHGKEVCWKGGGNDCNDSVSRTTSWIGKIGLMYPSDYGYAVGGDLRTTCLRKTMNSYNSGCINYDWLRGASNAQWTITPSAGSTYAHWAFVVESDGRVSSVHAGYGYAIRPTLYLKSGVKIVDRNYEDYGSIDHPFELEY